MVLSDTVCEILGIKCSGVGEDGRERAWRRENKLVYKLPINAI